MSLLVVLSLVPAVAFAQVVWTQAASSSPSARQPRALAFDSKRGVMVFFGGFSGDTLGDTWEWNGAKWKKLATSGPSPRQTEGMVYDSAREVMVLFGGFVCGVGCAEFVDDTWELDGKEWRQVATSGPSPRIAPLAYDSARGVTVLFSGEAGLSDTWEWDGKTWTQVSASGPVGRVNAAMAYDSRRGVTVLAVRAIS